MISVCCCAINAKWDVELFVEALNAHNDPSTFEICLCHDDRVQDGSREHFEQLQKRHPNLKIIRNTHEDTVDYLRKVMDYYESKGVFDPQFRANLRTNLEKFARKELFDHKKSFLWLTSGLLYNKAVSIASGDVLVITPADFLYLYRLADLSNFVAANTRNGHFYSKPNAIWARVSNQEKEWLENHVKKVHSGIGAREGYRWDNPEPFKDYLKCPPKLSDFYVPDFRNGELLSLSAPDWAKIYRFNTQSFIDGGVQVIPGFHGMHCMSKKTYDAIGGFTEEYPGRAFPDDKMTYLGRTYGGGHLPYEFSVAWLGSMELPRKDSYGYRDDWQEVLDVADPQWKDHPIPPCHAHVYLHSGILPDHEMIKVLNKNFSVNQKPIRIGPA